MKASFLELLRALDQFRVEYVVVGGVAAIIEGAPVATLDLGIVYRSENDDLQRLAQALESIEARYRDPAGRDIIPTLDRLRDHRTNLLETRIGLLDALQRIGNDWGYAEVLERSHERVVGNLRVRVLDLAAVIDSKEAAGRPKDRAMLPVLKQTLATKQGAQP